MTGWDDIVEYYGGEEGAPSDARMADRARGRLDYNHSRSGHAAPATELARYVLFLVERATKAEEALQRIIDCDWPVDGIEIARAALVSAGAGKA